MSILHEVLQDIDLSFERPHSFLSFYSYLVNCPIILCEMLSRYSLNDKNIGFFIPQMKIDLLRLISEPPKNILDDFPAHYRVLLISYIAEIFEILAVWSVYHYKQIPSDANPFYDAFESGQFSLQGSVYGQLKVNETLDRILTDDEILSLLKQSPHYEKSNQIEIDFSQRKAS